jgi:hypothetical protein
MKIHHLLSSLQRQNIFRQDPGCWLICLFVDIWVLPFPLEDFSVFGNFVVTLIGIYCWQCERNISININNTVLGSNTNHNFGQMRRPPTSSMMTSGIATTQPRHNLAFLNPGCVGVTRESTSLTFPTSKKMKILFNLAVFSFVQNCD